MNIKRILKCLQLFAEGAAAGGDGGNGSGEGTSTVVSGNADDGHQRLRELGVPEDKIRKNRAYKLPQRSAQAQNVQQEAPKGDPQPHTENKDNQPTEGTTRMTWEQIMADPEYNKEMQKTMQERLRKSGKELDAHSKMLEANRVLAMYYGLDPNNIDYEALAKKIQADDGYVEQRAMQNGVDNSIQRKLDDYALLKKQNEESVQERARQQIMDTHYEGLKTQAEKFREIVPGFDLDAEIRNNKEFARLVGPGVKVPVDMAYKLCHQDEIISAAVKAAQDKVAAQISASVQANARMPVENGASGQAPSVSTIDWKHASKEQRAAFKQKIKEAGARGEYIYPGR